MSLFHNSADHIVKFSILGDDAKPVVHEVGPGEECSVPDCYDAAAVCKAPQLKKGPAPKAAKVQPVAPPPADPKKSKSAPVS